MLVYTANPYFTIDEGKGKRKLPGVGSVLRVVFLPLARDWYDYSPRMVFLAPPTDRGRCNDTKRTSDFVAL